MTEFFPFNARAQTGLATGRPGKDAQWADAGKEGVGTSNTLESKVWFTLRDGAMTEVYYPTVDVANVRLLQFVIVSADGKRVETETEDTTHRVGVPDPQALTFRQVNTAKRGSYTITKTYTADPARSTVLIDVEFVRRGGEKLYVYYDPSLNNSGMHDSAWSQDGALLASDADKASALVFGPRPKEVGSFGPISNGYFETSDGLDDLRRGGQLNQTPVRAADGNVVQVALIPPEYSGRAFEQALGYDEISDTGFTLALGFGSNAGEALKNARQSLLKGFADARDQYEQGWHEYVKPLRRVMPKHQAQFDMAAMVLKAHEDKTHRGAMIASLTVPWGGGANANEANVGGYHTVWARDLYQVATAFDVMGDKGAAVRALNYLFTVQQKKDGSFPQNSWLDGRPYHGGMQLDQVAYPLILAYQQGRTDRTTWARHVKPAADFLLRRGPSTDQERWEEESGYSPSTIAAEIAGLVCAAEIARRNNDEACAGIYLAAADDWARNVARWTATSTGPHGDKTYYLRVTETDDPNDGAALEINSNGGTYDEREIVDAGFLELVRLGIKRADDPLIVKSLAVVDQTIKVETPHGAAWYRYNHDAYGERADGGRYDAKSGRGRLWTLLTGERGQYELARGRPEEARKMLDALAGFANRALMIPEQVWDRRAGPDSKFSFGEGTGSATPLAWAMAQFIRLVVNLQEGRNIETPDIVAARYVKKEVPPAAFVREFELPADEALQRMDAGEVFRVRARVMPGARLFVSEGADAREVPTAPDGSALIDVRVPLGESFVMFGVHHPNGATWFEKVAVRGLTREEKQRAGSPTLTEDSAGPLKNAGVSPLIEGNDVAFIYRGTAHRVEVVGDFTSWRRAPVLMSEVPGTDIKFYRRAFARDARVEYKFIADGQWINDPLNPNMVDNGVGGFNSYLVMPAYRAAAVYGDQQELAGTLEEANVESRLLNGTRRIQIYLPPGYARSKERYPVLYLQDGAEYLTRARAAWIADELIRGKRVAPFIIVFVNPADRMKEYWASDQFADFMARELVPFVDERYRTRAERSGRALLGASLGGVTSVWTALRHPALFARVGGQSSAFWIDDERVVGALARLDGADRVHPFRFYFDVGRLEPLTNVNRRVRVMLAARGYAVVYREAEAGHNWTNWRNGLADALLALWSD